MRHVLGRTIALATGLLLLSGALSQTLHAQGLLNISGTAILSPVFTPTGGAGSGYSAYPQEYVTVLWKVVENAPADYTYTYTVNDPTGDVQLSIPSGTLTSNPETVDAFQVSFDTTVPGTYDPGSQAGGPGTTTLNNDLTGGLFWGFNPVNPGHSSPTLSFESTLPPIFGYGQAQDSVSPSPWVSNPGETPNALIPVPVPEATTTALLVVALILFGSLPALPRLIPRRAEKLRLRQ